ncbi:queuine tRNA-ribosyltransferase family protein, partial [bacterium]|nr:queuine tRNA-ribosyltransferase family protein [bacterium]
AKLFLGPRESIKIQEKIGADIIFAFDECPPPLSRFEYVQEAVKRTHHWAKICLEVKKSKQAIFGIVQGSKFKALRQESARFINSLPFDGFGIGGDFGPAETTTKILKLTLPCLEEARPRHLLGIGHLNDIEKVIKCGVDLFDCTVPTHYGRHGVAFVSAGKLWKKLNLRHQFFLKDKKPLDSQCRCFVCQNYKRNYLSHLIRAKEITGLKLLTFHNLFFFNGFVAKIREKIKNGRI